MAEKKTPAEKKAAQQEKGLARDETAKPKQAPREERPEPVDLEHERGLEVDEKQGVEEMQPNRSQSDGGLRREQLPVVRVGEVWEDVRPSEDDHRRFVKVIDATPDEDGRVLVKNEESYQESRIRLDRFDPEHGWRRFAS